ncbi:mismatch-specific DNA-glycosylase [Aeromicrobium chenweiae]|uniref:Mismatch-specific DNA-glycosylase n=1 Tax=Aeromicrobium chenweiae TaxID=2079793 RepID=A0A2S0WJH9_9ACTN|nr:mismatch-specific DNA-glycosylase [Aeromicrobium chenweiae]AWB91496.1 mismatch-specific DNA-glycosylase [Aeromicrobium chenweiae]TGN29979.1 mismatch-specific DNA-glycosylase [Aeromicrobium chenweiae]
MGFTRAELEAVAGRTIPDLVPDDLRLLLVGINPGLVSAATGLHFARPGNRFYPALRLAGVLPPDVMTPEDAAPALLARGVGITNMVARSSARADELEDEEIRDGRHRLEELVAERRPRVVAFAGITTYRIAFADKSAKAGRQDRAIAGADVWVVPNPSGLNAHETVESLAVAYRAAAEAAAVV